jgi:hypothetical protein
MADRLLGLAPPPTQDPVVGPGGLLSTSWLQWFTRLPATLAAIPSRLNAVSLTAQDASLPATDFSGGLLGEGLYRATYYARITQAATSSSSLTVAFSWTEGGITQTATGTAITGNTTTSGGSYSTLMRVDRGSAVNYATTYASSGATPMLHSLFVVLEKIEA